MKFIPCGISGLYIIEPKVFTDERGNFFESYNKKEFTKNGLEVDFVQNNKSRSLKGVLRGMHYQKPPHAQDKLVRVVVGSVYDVAVDLRRNSPTYGKFHGVELSADNRRMFYIPKGFAHGFQVMSDSADFEYMVSDYYSPSDDAGVIWNDPDINIDWLHSSQRILSAKDQKWPNFKDLPAIF